MEIELNDIIQGKLASLLRQKQEIEQRLSDDINLIVESHGLAKDGATYTLTNDLKILVKYENKRKI